MNVTGRPEMPVVQLTKGETARLLEASYIVGRIAGVLPIGSVSQSMESLRESLQATAGRFGAKHLDAEGVLKQPESRKVADASAAG